MAYEEIPSDEEVVAALRGLGGSATALQLCNKLVEQGHVKRDSQLAIQRATERQRIRINDDWTLVLAEEAVAA